MAFSRKALKAMGLTDEQVDTLVDMHAETVDALKTQISTYKADADKLADVQKELDSVNEKLKAADTDGFKSKYETEHKAFEDYKADVSKKETDAAKTRAYKALLTAAGLKGEKLIDTVLKGVDLSKVELEGEGLKDADKLTESIKAEWSDYITTGGTKGNGNTQTPPNNTQAHKYTAEELRGMSAAEINANWDNIKASLNGGGKG